MSAAFFDSGLPVLPSIPGELVESGRIPILGEVGPGGGVVFYGQKSKPKRGNRPKDPTPEEIKAACLEIQAEWSFGELLARGRGEGVRHVA